MATIVLSYKGTCEGGPWNGQRVDAEFGFVNAPGGVYRWNHGVWQWKQRIFGDGQTSQVGPVDT